ncbi:AraC family transcriptional regulator [Luteolibacter soli]|uniref:DNA-binding transcriptional regulator n=1 Tax=Luteolibacter soli TaxID=3135280 RepID=A0ABU9AQ40_9BACT
MKRQKSVLLALGWHDHRLLAGIAAYAAEHHWHISAASITKELAIPWGWSGDGVLAWLAGSDELCEFVQSLHKPTVDFSLRRANLPFTHVVQDHAECARLAADHFIRRGFKNFLFYSDSGNWTFEERGDGFVRAVAKHGHDCTWIRWHSHKSYRKGRGEWTERRAWLAAKIGQAKKPLAVFAANGTLAVEVQEVCDLADIAVPQEVSIIGIEDDLLLPQSSQRPITAVDPDFENLGYQGAAWLDRMMNGIKVDPTPIRIPPTRIIARRSTDITAVNHPGVAKALRFIAEHFSENIDIDTVARTAGISRRGLHQAFIEHLGLTPGEHIRSTRIEHAKRLLGESNNKVESVAFLCGYQSVNSFFIAFKQACGMPPGEFRKQALLGRVLKQDGEIAVA